MKMVWPVIVSIMSIALLATCKPESEAPPMVITEPVALRNNHFAMTGGNVTEDGGSSIVSRGICWSTQEHPTIEDNRTIDSLGKGRYTSFLKDLQPETSYFIKAYAINKSGVFYGKEIQFTTTGDISDIDGNTYPTVGIGTQTWLAENLKTAHYADGTPLQEVSDRDAWSALSKDQKAYCWYNSDSALYGDTYGALYTWAGAMNGASGNTNTPAEIQGVCPSGWHLPSDTEWTTMEEYMLSLGFQFIGDAHSTGHYCALALAGTDHWLYSYNPGAIGSADFPMYRNITRFTALPGGLRFGEGSFGYEGSGGYWWSSTENEAFTAWIRIMNYDYPSVDRLAWEKKNGYSVRCVKNNGNLK